MLARDSPSTAISAGGASFAAERPKAKAAEPKSPGGRQRAVAASASVAVDCEPQ